LLISVIYLRIILIRFSKSCGVGNGFVVLLPNIKLIGSDRRDNEIER